MKINKTILDQIRKKHNLSLIILHGSQVDNKLHDKSDVDIAVVRHDRSKSLEYFKLLKDLSKIFPIDKIDLADITNADPLFLFSVINKSKLLSGQQKGYDELSRIAFHKYSDYQPYLKIEAEFVKERLKSYVTT